MAPHASLPYESCVDLCINLEQPGCLGNEPFSSDWSQQQETTPAESRIQEVLARQGITGKKLLHIGVGNSNLATRFCGVLHSVDGITLSSNEKSKADSLRLRNYKVLVFNKFSRALSATLSKQYDLIIDVNLASFACCKYHVHLMFDNYVAALERGGQILTDQEGMDWVAGDPRWKLEYNDLATLASKFSLATERITDMVLSLRKT